MPSTNPRLWCVVQPDEAEAFQLRAAALGTAPAALLRSLLVAYLRGDSPAPAQPTSTSPADLATAAAALERTAAMLVAALPSAEAAAEMGVQVRRSLDEIAEAVGTVAGAVVPLETDADNFGLHPAR